jgi:hypothetical protein
MTATLEDQINVRDSATDIVTMSTNALESLVKSGIIQLQSLLKATTTKPSSVATTTAPNTAHKVPASQNLLDKIKRIDNEAAAEIQLLMNEFDDMSKLLAVSKAELQKKLMSSSPFRYDQIKEEWAANTNDLEVDLKLKLSEIDVLKAKHQVQNGVFEELLRSDSGAESVVNKHVKLIDRIVVTMEADDSNDVEFIRRCQPLDHFNELQSHIMAAHPGYRCVLYETDGVSIVGNQDEYEFACEDCVQDTTSKKSILQLKLRLFKAKRGHDQVSQSAFPRWSVIESEQFESGIKAYGWGQWKAIAGSIPNRDAEQVRAYSRTGPGKRLKSWTSPVLLDLVKGFTTNAAACNKNAEGGYDQSHCENQWRGRKTQYGNQWRRRGIVQWRGR